MNHLNTSLLYFCSLILPINSYAASLDDKLQLIKQVYQLEAKSCQAIDSQIISSKKYVAGKTAFESKSLSGNRDISCLNCHLEEFNSTDGLSIAIGVGGVGAGEDRLEEGKGILVQRNALSLKGRGDQNEFTALFWDGKVQLDNGRIVSQFGDKLPDKINTVLAAASILPIIERDELIGKQSILETNEIESAVDDKVYFSRYQAVSNAINDRLNNSKNEDDRKLAETIIKADIDIKSVELADIGNLIAFFIKNNFPCEYSSWDRYLNSELDALTERQKEGAILFYGKGRCASCHAGVYFSDFSYHSIGVPQGDFGPHSRHRDIGRAGVTNRVEDLYLFRTPPLTLANETAPYGHNGAFNTLKEVIVHHYNPIEYYINNPEFYENDNFIIGKLLSSRDPVLSMIDISSNEELDKLIEFINSL